MSPSFAIINLKKRRSRCHLLDLEANYTRWSHVFFRLLNVSRDHAWSTLTLAAMLEVVQCLSVPSNGTMQWLRVYARFFFSCQVYLTVLKHGDSGTLDTMLKVRLAAGDAASPAHVSQCAEWRCSLTHSCRLWFVSPFCHQSAPQAGRHARGEEPHWASPRRHLSPRPHPESPQLRPLGSRRSPPPPTAATFWLLWRSTARESHLPLICLPLLQEDVRPQDTVSVIGGVAGSSKQGRKAAWKFVKDNWEELYNRYQGGFLISRLIKVEAPATVDLLFQSTVSIGIFYCCCWFIGAENHQSEMWKGHLVHMLLCIQLFLLCWVNN